MADIRDNLSERQLPADAVEKVFVAVRQVL